MGCDSHLFLPPTVKQDDFIKVFAAMLGGEADKMHFGEGTSHSGWAARIEHRLVAQSTHSTDYNVITGRVGDSSVYLNWHWCAGGEYGFPAHHLVSCSSRDYRFPVLKALADFFGGYVDYNDCDSVLVDHIGRQNNLKFRHDATDDDGWYQKQEVILAVTKVQTSRSWDGEQC